MFSKLRFTQFVFLCLILSFAVFTPASHATAATDRLPDLGMARLTEIRIEKTSDGRRLLRFTTIIVNVGRGPLEVHGQRPDTSTELMSATQRIFDDAGGYRDVATSSEMFFSGDGHNHWHLKDLATYELIRKDNGVKVGTGAKTGFCFFDTLLYKSSLPGAPQSARYSGCGNSGDLTIVMGLSVGWGDRYSYNLAYQYIDITGLIAGRYRIQVTADANGWFQEVDESNNFTWVDIQLKSNSGNSLKIIAYGPNV
jgi:hypothetical protein